MERGEKLFGEVCITIEEIQMIIGGDYETAEQVHRIVRESLEYHSDDLLVTNYCEYYDLDIDDIIEFLNGVRFESEWIGRIETPEFDLELDEVDQVPYVLRHFPFELFDKNVETDLEDFENFLSNEIINEEGGINGCSTNNQ